MIRGCGPKRGEEASKAFDGRCWKRGKKWNKTCVSLVAVGSSDASRSGHARTHPHLAKVLTHSSSSVFVPPLSLSLSGILSLLSVLVLLLRLLFQDWCLKMLYSSLASPSACCHREAHFLPPVPPSLTSTILCESHLQ